MATFLSDYFNIDQQIFDDYGALNISTVNDLPLFIDPFLLFHSEKQEYVNLHEDIIKYLIFLRDRSYIDLIDEGLLKSWYCFPEVKQNWLGFSITGNKGSGLGINFARALHSNLHKIFSEFGSEKITKSSHLEKVCLIENGVGRDSISDFTTNLIKDYLCKYTEKFAAAHLQEKDIREISVRNSVFDFPTQSWKIKKYKLPWVNNDYIILTPKDMLTRDENWINRHDLLNKFTNIPPAIPDEQLRAQVFNYFRSVLVHQKDKSPSKKEREDAAAATILEFPDLIDFYIKLKEETGNKAADISAEKVLDTQQIFVKQLHEFQKIISIQTDFYKTSETTYEETHKRLNYLKDAIENKGCHRIFYNNGVAIQKEQDLQILFRLVWYGSPSDAGTEANDGRGPVDFKISKGANDKTLVEMKLAKNSQLERNLEKQIQIYQAASDAKNGIKVIIYFTKEEKEKVLRILRKLNLFDHKDVVLIDARADNKPSGSKA
jgi:hypothetical protein